MDNRVENFTEAEAMFKFYGVMVPPKHLAEDATLYPEQWIAAVSTPGIRLDEVETEFRRLQSEADFDRYAVEVADDCPF